MENNRQNKFAYTYRAREQDEIKKIRAKYTNSEEDKMERVRRLDRQVTEKAELISLVLGISGALLLGLCMSIIMTELHEFFGTPLSIIIGILSGVIGTVLTVLAYPIYIRTLKKEREKAAPEIIRLTDELIK